MNQKFPYETEDDCEKRNLSQALVLAREVVELFENTTQTEREILKVLINNGGMTTNEIAQKTGKVYPQVCTYLNKLEGKGILASLKKGSSRKKKQYIINENYLRAIWAWIVSQKNSIRKLRLSLKPNEIQELLKR